MAPEPHRRADLGAAGGLVLFGAFALLLLAVYAPALSGPFVSDDRYYVLTNPYIQTLTVDEIAEILDPRSPVKFYTTNYAPVHVLLHGLERQLFGDAVTPYHVVNVLLHAAAATLLAALLLSTGIPLAASVLGALLFALHPAQVEAVAWISQLKSVAALVLALAALLAQRDHPGRAALLFGVALLTKASAAFALPMAAALTWSRRGGPGAGTRHWAWLGVWTVGFALYAIPESETFRHVSAAPPPEFADPFLHARTVAAIGARYLAMAATSYGIAAWQNPPLASLLDPWWLAALPLGALLAWRALYTLSRGRAEAGWWIGAAAAFAPVSQLFPFLYGMADRYLYFVLPGLIGGTLAWGHSLWARRQPGSSAWARPLLVASLLIAAFFAWRSWERAALWRDETLLIADAARHRPDGAWGRFLEARSAARAGDATAAAAAMRAAAQRGVDPLVFANEAGFQAVWREPAVRIAMRDVTRRWIAERVERGWSTQPELRSLAHAHLLLGEYARAAEQLERAIRAGGPLEPELRREIEMLRAGRIPRSLSVIDGEPEREGSGDRAQEP
jgi:hypothetical protein